MNHSRSDCDVHKTLYSQENYAIGGGYRYLTHEVLVSKGYNDDTETRCDPLSYSAVIAEPRVAELGPGRSHKKEEREQGKSAQWCRVRLYND